MLPKSAGGKNLERGQESIKYARGAQENLWPKLFSGAPRCAPLRLRLLEHMPCLWQVIENTMAYTWLLCRICSGRARFTSVRTTQNIGQTPVKFITGVIFLGIFGGLIEFRFLFAPSLPMYVAKRWQTPTYPVNDPLPREQPR